MDKIDEFAPVLLTQEVSGFPAGTIGTIVHVHGDGEAYEVELFDDAGNTIDVKTVMREALRRR